MEVLLLFPISVEVGIFEPASTRGASSVDDALNRSHNVVFNEDVVFGVVAVLGCEIGP